MTSLTAYGKAVRKLRIDHAMPAARLAKRLGVSVAYLYRTEVAGETNKFPTKQLIAGIADELGSTIEEKQYLEEYLNWVAWCSKRVYELEPVNEKDRELIMRVKGMHAKLTDAERDAVIELLNNLDD